MDTLPPVPVDDTWLDLYEEALSSLVDVDDEGNTVRDGFGLQHVLDFIAGHDPNDVTVLREGDPYAADAADRMSYVASHSPTYAVEDLISALIGEVRRLRSASDE